VSDFIVIGGGVIGLLTARELALAGADVILLERNSSTGRESSWAGGGILSPLYPWRSPEAVNALAYWGQAVYKNLAQELNEATAIDSEWLKSGMLVLEALDNTTALAWANRNAIRMQRLSPSDVRELAPELVETQSDTLYMPDVAQIRNPRLVKALRKYLLLLGVKIHENTHVTGGIFANFCIRGVTTSTQQFDADQVVLAGGAWSANILGELGPTLSIVPVRGQMLLYQAASDMISHIYLKDGHYVIPRCDGHILVGSTVESVGFDKSTTGEAREQLQAVAEKLVPQLSKCPIEKQWAGLRPGSPEGVPVISAHPYITGLYMNVGHFRNGVVIGASSARLLADIALDRTPLIDPASYRLLPAEG